MTTPGDPAQTDAADEIRAAYKRAVTAAERQADAERAYRDVTVISEAVKAIGRETSVLRARIAQQLMDSDRLSLSQLAERLGVSKARADQLIRIARGPSEDASRR